MKCVIGFTLVWLACALASGQEKAAVAPKAVFAAPEGVTEKAGVAYATGKNGALLADFFIPKRSGTMPAVVFIHGGGWRSGDRTQLRKVAAALAEKGYVGMMIDYDLSGGAAAEVHYPTALYECKEAVRWLRAHAAAYQVDVNKIVVAGSSAGGQLSAMMGVTNGEARYEGSGLYREFASTVRAAIVFNGELDLTADADDSASVVAYLGGRCSTLKELCADASPQKHVRAGLVPFYVGHGTVDPTVAFSQYVHFVDAMKAAGNTVRGFPAEGAKHTYWSDPRFFQSNVEAVEEFLGGVLGKP